MVLLVKDLVSPILYLYTCLFPSKSSKFSLVNFCRLHSYHKYNHIFSSPELKAQVSFSDRLLSICLSIRLCVNFYIFDFFRTNGPILSRLGGNHPWGEGILNCSNEGDCLSSRRDNSKRVKIHSTSTSLILKSSSPEPTGQFQSNLVQSILW
jgi:hypothetical protein